MHLTKCHIHFTKCHNPLKPLKNICHNPQVILEEETHHLRAGTMPFTWNFDHFLEVFESQRPPAHV
jgi:hypothetical protein